tara:strand:- start:1922 stop:2620 length:699 start_codon:yes stop_codon:yes gene_type:complete
MTPPLATILIIEDSLPTARILSEFLTENHFNCVKTYDGKSGLSAVKTCAPDIILLDWELPTLSGINVCKKLRQLGYSIPIIMLTAKTKSSEEVMALDLGADDFVRKPANKKVILARIKNCLERRNSLGFDDFQTWSRHDVQLDFKTFKATNGGEAIHLTTKEFEMLKLLINAKGSPISRERFLTTIWNYENASMTRTVDNYILSLRRKLEVTPEQPKIILTRRGAGYYIPEE